MRLTRVEKHTNRDDADTCVQTLPQYTVGTVTPVTLEVVGTGGAREEFFGTSRGVSATFANPLTSSSCVLEGWMLPAVRYSASLFALRCDPDTLTIRCDSGEVREMRLLRTRPSPERNVDVVMQLSIDGRSATGSVSETWDEFIPGNVRHEAMLRFWSELSVSKE